MLVGAPLFFLLVPSVSSAVNIALFLTAEDTEDTEEPGGRLRVSNHRAEQDWTCPLPCPARDADMAAKSDSAAP